MKNTHSKIFILLLSVLFIADMLDKTRSYSSYEKRNLALLPKWDLESLIDGSLTMDLEKYINDQFIGRDDWIRFKASLETMMGKVENNGILLGKDGQLFEKRLVLNPQSELNLKFLSEFLTMYSDLPITTVLVPNKDAILPENLPKGFPMLNSLDLLKTWQLNLGLTDLSQVLLTHKSEKLYYKTDHHWTLKGAYVAYETLMNQWDLEVQPYDVFLPFEIEGFLGTYFNKSRFESIESEKLTLIDPVIVSYEINGKVFKSLIDRDALNGNDQYSAFLHGNHGFGRIVVRDSTAPKKLLVIKDSYANSLIPFMTAAFDQIDVIDLRQFNGSIKNVLTDNHYDQILVLQSFNQFSDEINEAKLRY